MAVPTDRYYREVVAVNDDIQEARIREKLLLGDAKAYLEAARAHRDRNAEAIRLQRMENKKKREDLATTVRGDEHVVAAAFSHAGKAMPPRFRGMPCKKAADELDRAISLEKKRLNRLQYNNRQREAKMDGLHTVMQERHVEHESVRAQEEGESEEAKRLRALENDLMRMNLKLDEGRHLHTVYRRIVEKMKEDRLHYDRLVKAMAIALNEKGKSFEELASIYDTAVDTTDDIKSYMATQEERLQSHREKNEETLSKYQKLAEKHRDQDIGKTQEQAASPRLDEYHQMVQRMATAIGVTSPDEVIQRFLNQSETHKSLKVAAEQSQLSVSGLKQQKEQLDEAFEKMKYSQESKVSRGQQLLEDVRSQTDTVKAEDAELAMSAKEVQGKLEDVRNGINHLSQKLVHLKEPTLSVATHPMPQSDEEFILDMLSSCEAKLCALTEELEEREIDILGKEMEDVEFKSSMADKLPEVNFRIDLSEPIPEKQFGDDEDSGDDNDVLTRDKLKKEAQEFTDAKTKKKKKKK